MQNSRVKEIMKKAAVIPEKGKLYALLHKEQDFTALYNFLLSKYQGREDCPALLFLDDCNPSIIKDRNGLEAVILDRNSDNLKREIKNIIRKPGVVTDCKAFETFWVSDNRYDILYRIVLDICSLLKIPAPAIFLSKRMPSTLKNGMEARGLSYPGDKPYTTDIFVKGTMDSPSIIKTLSHELRHAWQHKYHNDWFDDYSTEKSGNEYALQKAEIDADAFAYLYLEQYGMHYILSDLGETIFKALSKRMDEIREQKLFVDYHPIFLE